MASDTTVSIVQSGFHPGDYSSAEAFAAKISWCFETIAIRGKRGHPRPHLVVFPESTGMWLPLLTGKVFRSLASVVAHRLLSSPFRAASGFLAGRGCAFLFLNAWENYLEAWIEPFRAAARRYDTYVCPGSAFLPDLDWQPGTGWHQRGSRIWNSSCLINPQGRILGWTRKIYLSRKERALGVEGATPADVMTYRTELGSIGILIGKDGFYERSIERLDRQDCRIVLMPSANQKAWTAPARAGAIITEEQEWLSRGLGNLIQGRENISVSINPMSVSWILDHRDEGRSSVSVNRNNPVRLDTREKFPVEYNGYPGLDVIASCHDCEEIVSFTIES